MKIQPFVISIFNSTWIECDHTYYSIPYVFMEKDNFEIFHVNWYSFEFQWYLPVLIYTHVIELIWTDNSFQFSVQMTVFYLKQYYNILFAPAIIYIFNPDITTAGWRVCETELPCFSKFSLKSFINCSSFQICMKISECQSSPNSCRLEHM